ncbi:hypothetical protein V2J09_010502 [Rumex salicifolius]
MEDLAEMWDDLKLLGFWGSPFSRRVQIALDMKGLEYTYIEQDIYFKSDELIKHNPVHKKVPVLLHGQNSIPESQVIIEYIDEMWQSGPPILPRPPLERAKARFWARFIDEECLPSLWKAFWGPEEEEEKAREEAQKNLKALEKLLDGNRFFGGESFGYLDIVANFIGYWLSAIEEVVKKPILTKEYFPLLSKWQQEFVNLDFVKCNLPPRPRIVAFYSIRMEAAKSFKKLAAN